MKRMMLIPLFLLLLALPESPASAHPHILDTTAGMEITFDAMIEDIHKSGMVFIGELHNHPGHHRMQLEVIKALANRSDPVAIGLEMFRQDSQESLDLWVQGELSEEEFIPRFRENWSMWQEYGEIFRFARDRGIEMIGLNIDREITRKVAGNGFASLPKEQAEALGTIRCNITPAYKEYIRRAMGGHGGHAQSFVHFCEAQVLWDQVMANRLITYLKKRPGTTVVVLAGSGHSWKHGVPAQIAKLGPTPYRVLLPEIPGRSDRTTIGSEDADYLWLSVGDEGWEVPHNSEESFSRNKQREISGIKSLN